MQGEIDHININSPGAIGGARDHRRARACQGVDGDAPRGQGDILSPADPLVGAHAVDLDGGHGTGNLHDRPGQGAQRIIQASVEGCSGAVVAEGTDMLVFQGASQVQLMTGRSPDPDVMRHALHEELARRARESGAGARA